MKQETPKKEKEMNTATKSNTRVEKTSRSSSERQIFQEPVKVNVPEDIKHPKFARAYAHAFNAARQGTFLSFVAPAYRWVIARGWKAGEGARKFDAYARAKRIEFDLSAYQTNLETAPF